MNIALFFIVAVLLFYTYVGYPFLLLILAYLFDRPIQKSPAHFPRVSVILVARNEEALIEARLRNLTTADYPPDLLEIVLVSDGSTDETNRKALALNLPFLHLIEMPQPSGKTACLNAGIIAATGEILIFADTRQNFDPAAIRELAANFADPAVGAVSGNLSIAPAAAAIGAGVGHYWIFEKIIRHAESSLDSAIGCTGAIYAMRHSLAHPLPPDTILDDVILPMQAALAGYRIIFDPTAQAFDPLPQEPTIENRRKERTLAGNFQMLFRYPSWLLPWKNRLCWQLLSHKYLRLLSPLLLIVLLALTTSLLPSPFFIACLLIQVAFYSLAILGGLIPLARTPLLTAPAAFLFLNIMVVRGFFRYLGRSYSRGWKYMS